MNLKSTIVMFFTTVAAGGSMLAAPPVTVADSISAAIDRQLSMYPALQYRDVYKNFMQDFFGPGHILADTVAAENYLRRELADEGPWGGPLYEPAGFRGNYYRVNLSLIRDGIVDLNIFFNTFVESTGEICQPDGGTWMEMWNRIDSVIAIKGLTFPEEAKDRAELDEQFHRGNYVVHHSQRFNESTRFHYRIIARDKFINVLLPLIEKKDEE